MKDYIPRRDIELAAWSVNFVSQIESHAGEWDISAEEVNGLKTSFNDFASLLAQSDSPAKNSIITAKKNAAARKLIAGIRALAGFKLKNPAVTPAQRVSLGLRARDATVSVSPAPSTRPEFKIVVRDVRRLKFSFRDMGAAGHARPYGMSGALIAYAVLEAPPASVDALTGSVMATRTPYTLEFTEQERGKKLYAALCWQNKKGEKGPWSNIASAIIP
jgi:hypothetical protein